jgi:hypothetical protein
MKYFLLALVALYSCSDKGKTVQSVVEEYEKKHANDPASYQPIETKVDSFFVGYEYTPEGKRLVDSINDAQAAMTEDQKIAFTTDPVHDTLFERKHRFKQVWYGWVVVHNYRSKNELGAPVVGVDTFYLDKNMDIVKQEDIKLSGL